MRHPIFSPVPCPRSLVGSDYVSTLKAVPCWVLNFCDKPLNLFRNFSFYGVKMRTCYARPETVYILSREDRLILRKEGFLAKLFYFYITVLTASLFPCWGSGFWFWFPAQHISIAQFLGSRHILNVRCLVQFPFISRLFKDPLKCLFLGCHPCLWDLWLSFLFSTWVDAFPCSPCWGIGGKYLSLCNLNLKFNLSFDRSLWGCCQYLVAGLILSWIVGISRTVNFGGLRLVFSGHISTVHLWGGTWVLIH